MVFLICGIFKKKKKNMKQREYKSGCQELRGGGNEMLVKWYKLPIIRRISSRDLMYNIVIIVNNTQLYTWNLP